MRARGKAVAIALVTASITSYGVGGRSSPSKAWGGSPPDDRRKSFILCNRDAEVTVAKESPTTADDPCSGTLVLQGISYQCGPLSDVDPKRKEFVQDLNRNGRQFCEDYCKGRSTLLTSCRGVFKELGDCGFTVPTAEAARFGKELAPCNPACGGTAFAYCSIYHGSYLGTDLSLVADNPPNCTCVSGKAD